MSRFFFYGYVTLAIYALANIFISIVRDSYLTVSKQSAQKQNLNLDQNEELWQSLLDAHTLDDDRETLEEMHAEIKSVVKQKRKEFEKNLQESISKVVETSMKELLSLYDEDQL